MKSSVPIKDLDIVRMIALRLMPYYSHALFACSYVQAKGLDTFGCDSEWRVYVDPAKLREWGLVNAAGVLLHEVEHLVRDHGGRAQRHGVTTQTEAHKWNVCADALINHGLSGAGVSLPPDGVTLAHVPGALPEHTVEELFDLHRPTCREEDQGSGQDSSDSGIGDPGKGGPGQGGQGAGQGAQGGQGAGQGAQGGQGAGQGAQGGQGAGQGAQGGQGAGTCAGGSGAAGVRAPWELDPSTQGQGPGQGGPRGLDPAEAELVRRQVAQSVLDHVRSHGRDSVPFGLASWAEGKLAPPRIDWRRALAGLVRGEISAAGQLDYTWRRPSRRGAPGGVLLPAMHAPKPEVAIVTDTSGSMGSAEISRARSEVEGVCKALGAPLTVLSVDAAVHSTSRTHTARGLVLPGGGGTDMRVGLRAASKLRPRPRVVIVITDGYTPWPADRLKGQRLVVVLVTPLEQLGAMRPPEWARVLEVTP